MTSKYLTMNDTNPSRFRVFSCNSCCCCSCCRGSNCCPCGCYLRQRNMDHHRSSSSCAQDPKLIQIDTIFSAADASLRAFRQSSLASATLRENYGVGEATFEHIQTAVSSQAAATIAWILAAASIVLEDDNMQSRVEIDRSNMDGIRRNSCDDRRQTSSEEMQVGIFRRPMHDHRISSSSSSRSRVQMSRRSSNAARARLARWQWRPVITSTSSCSRAAAVYDDASSCITSSSPAQIIDKASMNSVANSTSNCLPSASCWPPSFISPYRISERPFGPLPASSCQDHPLSSSICALEATTCAPITESIAVSAEDHSNCGDSQLVAEEMESIELDLLDRTCTEKNILGQGSTHESPLIVSHAVPPATNPDLDSPRAIFVQETDSKALSTSDLVCSATESPTAHDSIMDRRASETDQIVNAFQATKNQKKHMKRKQRKSSDTQ